jgi:hypothetical protein
LNNAEKSGGIISAHNPPIVDASRTFNAKCVEIGRLWAIGWGRFFATIGIPDFQVNDNTADAAKIIDEHIEMYALNENINALLNPFDVQPNYNGRVLIIVDRPSFVDNEFAVGMMLKIAMLPFYMKAHGVDVVGVAIPIKDNALFNDDFNFNLETIQSFIESCRRKSAFERRHYTPRDILESFINTLLGDPNDAESFIAYDHTVMISFYNESGGLSPFMRNDVASLLPSVHNLIHHKINVQDADNGIRRVITNEAGI